MDGAAAGGIAVADQMRESSPEAVTRLRALGVAVVMLTGDQQGIVRVGPIEGGEPHLLLGHAGPVGTVAVSPDGQWIASSSGTEIRLWPMPDQE